MRTDIDNSRGYRQIDPRAEHISDQRESSSADNSARDSARHSTAGIQATPEQAEGQVEFTTTGIHTSNSSTGIQSVREPVRFRVAKHHRGYNPSEKHHRGFRSATSTSRDSSQRKHTGGFSSQQNSRVLDFETSEATSESQPAQQRRFRFFYRTLLRIQKGFEQPAKSILRDSRQQESLSAAAIAPQQRAAQRQLQQAGGQADYQQPALENR